jgi:hypothetical protein
MKHQTDLQLIGYIGKYGGFFMCIAYWLTLLVRKTEVGFNQLNSCWMKCIDTKDENGGTLISGDINGDGLCFEVKSGVTSHGQFRLAKKAYKQSRKDIDAKYEVNIE